MSNEAIELFGGLGLFIIFAVASALYTKAKIKKVLMRFIPVLPGKIHPNIFLPSYKGELDNHQFNIKVLYAASRQSRLYTIKIMLLHKYPFKLKAFPKSTILILPKIIKTNDGNFDENITIDSKDEIAAQLFLSRPGVRENIQWFISNNFGPFEVYNDYLQVSLRYGSMEALELEKIAEAVKRLCHIVGKSSGKMALLENIDSFSS